MTNLELTKKTMLEAPRNAFYVWPDKALAIPKVIAKEVGRSDLTIVSPGFFGYKGRGYGMRVKIIIDPICTLPVTKLIAIDRCNTLKEPE